MANNRGVRPVYNADDDGNIIVPGSPVVGRRKFVEAMVIATGFSPVGAGIVEGLRYLAWQQERNAQLIIDADFRRTQSANSVFANVASVGGPLNVSRRDGLVVSADGNGGDAEVRGKLYQLPSIGPDGGSLLWDYLVSYSGQFHKGQQGCEIGFLHNYVLEAGVVPVHRIVVQFSSDPSMTSGVIDPDNGSGTQGYKLVKPPKEQMRVRFLLSAGQAVMQAVTASGTGGGTSLGWQASSGEWVMPEASSITFDAQSQSRLDIQSLRVIALDPDQTLKTSFQMINGDQDLSVLQQFDKGFSWLPGE